jgi:predicted nucleic acid-binding protein
MALSIWDQVPDGATVLIDTNPIVYVLEGSQLASAFRPLFAAVDAGRIRAMVTPITVAEVVTGPLKRGKEALAVRYRQTIKENVGWAIRDIDADIAVLAARLRLRHGLRLPDAIQLAVALEGGCYALATHDRDFRKVREVRILGG